MAIEGHGVTTLHRPLAVGPLPGRPVPGHGGAGARHGTRGVAGGPQRRPHPGVPEGRLRAPQEPRIQSGEEERAGVQALHAAQHVHAGDQQSAGKQLHPPPPSFCCSPPPFPCTSLFIPPLKLRFSPAFHPSPHACHFLFFLPPPPLLLHSFLPFLCTLLTCSLSCWRGCWKKFRI